MSKSDLLSFLSSQQNLAVASQDNELWITNVFMGVEADDKNCLIYFVGPDDSKHSQQILQNNQVAFASAWFNPNNHADRKGIRGQGTCQAAEDDKLIAIGVRLHNQNYPEFKDRVTVAAIKDPANPRRVWVIRPTYIKFLNDEAYGPNGTEAFRF